MVRTEALKPALILGSGYHRNVFGEGADHGKRSILVDWQALVSKVSERMQVVTPTMSQSPVLRWESLILLAARDGYRYKKNNKEMWRDPIARHNRQIQNHPNNETMLATHRIEMAAKAVVAELLDVACEDYPKSRRALITADPGWGCVISLNFDLAWRPKPDGIASQYGSSFYGFRDAKGISNAERRRLTESLASVANSKETPVPRLWFPNGTVLRPKSIRMGLRDYGSAPEAIRCAFYRLTNWENEREFDKSPRDQAWYAIVNSLKSASEPCYHPTLTAFFDINTAPECNGPPLTWVMEFMYRPLVIAGVGLSDQESGLWWLLAQRARTFASYHPSGGQSVRILLKRSASNSVQHTRDAFWASRPFGISPLYCDDWDDGWDQIIDNLHSNFMGY